MSVHSTEAANVYISMPYGDVTIIQIHNLIQQHFFQHQLAMALLYLLHLDL